MPSQWGRGEGGERLYQLWLLCRKQDFRELKQLHREEMKEATEFYAKIKVDREVQDRKFEVENAVSGTSLLAGSSLLAC